MWKCKKCGEENEDSFDSCWSCAVSEDGSVAVNPKESRYIKEDAAKGETPTGYTSTYGTARGIAQFVSFVGWIVVGISGLVLIVILAKSTESRGNFALMGLLPALGGVISGLLLVMAGQLTRATVDTADNTGQMLSVMKRRKER
jgi:hypothetical protein